MACWELLQSWINIWSGAETDRDNGPHCPDLGTERGVSGEEGLTRFGSVRYRQSVWQRRQQLLTLQTEDLVCVRAFWFKDGSDIPLTSVTSSAHICCVAFFFFEKHSDIVVRATAVAAQPTQQILTLCVRVCDTERAWSLHALTKPHSADVGRTVNSAQKYSTSLSF